MVWQDAGESHYGGSNSRASRIRKVVRGRAKRDVCMTRGTGKETEMGEEN